MQLSHLPISVGDRPGTPPVQLASWSDTGAGAVGSRIKGKRILVVEDEFLLADEIVDWLSLRGAEPVGPFASLRQAQALLARGTDLDAALLDINLAGTMVFPLALELARRGVPLLFATAYAEDAVFPDELKSKMRLKKPFSEAQLIRAVELALANPH